MNNFDKAAFIVDASGKEICLLQTDPPSIRIDHSGWVETNPDIINKLDEILLRLQALEKKLSE